MTSHPRASARGCEVICFHRGMGASPMSQRLGIGAWARRPCHVKEATPVSKLKLPVHVRLATLDALVAINDIYNHYVLTSTATYQETLEPIEGRRAWFARHRTDAHPATVAHTDDGEVVGWGSLS